MKRYEKFGVNALNGLFPFLHKGGGFEEYNSLRCVNALNGLFPFLRQVVIPHFIYL